MNKQMAGWVLVVLGLVLALIGVIADTIFTGGQPGMGYKQILLVIVGIIAAIIGLGLARRQQA